VARVAEEWGVSPLQLSLTYLAEHGPEATADIFAEHRRAFLELTAEIEETAATNRRMANSALETIRDSLQATVGPLGEAETADTYDTRGRRTTLRTASRRLEQLL
jgi:hypothetical protein